MADDSQDDSQKTEEPTQKRLTEAREKGQIARSQEVNHWFMILAFAILVGVLAPGAADGVTRTLQSFIERPHMMAVDGGALGPLLRETVARLGRALALPALVALLAAAAAGLVQTGFLLSAEPVKPKLEKISPLKGLKRLFSVRSLVEFLKGIIKLAIVALVIAALLWPERGLVTAVVGMDLPQFLVILQTLGLRVLLGVLAVMSVIAGLDFHHGGKFRRKGAPVQMFGHRCQSVL